MKILQLAPQFPFPEDEGGKIGLASTFRQLSRQADVTFFCYSKQNRPMIYLDMQNNTAK